MRGEPPHPAAGPIVLTVSGAVARADIPALCERLRALSAGGDAATGGIMCDVGGLAAADAVAVDALASLQLTARRLGRRIQLRHASAELQALLTLMGLSEVLTVEPVRSGQPQRQAEQREQPRRIQEERDATDPSLR